MAGWGYCNITWVPAASSGEGGGGARCETGARQPHLRSEEQTGRESKDNR